MREQRFQIPAEEIAVRELRAGQRLLLSGTLITARDHAHRWLAEKGPDELSPLLAGGALYHCGPIMRKRGDVWTCKAAGPTSSLRQEPYMAELIREYGIRCIIGKGGMGPETAEALQEYGAVYCSAVGGAAVLYANAVESVKNVFQLERFGMPEALWLMKVRDFPVMVSMDTHGNSLYRDIEKLSGEKLKRMF